MTTTPNKAQHSPLPDRSTKRQWSESAQQAIQDAGYWKTELRKTKAHADKLDEALRDCITSPGALAEKSHEYALRRIKTITEAATYAIAAYESEVQP